MVRETEAIYAVEQRTKVGQSKDAEETFRRLWSDIDAVESFYAFALNIRHQVLGFKLISIGGVSGCMCDPKVVFSFALQIRGCTSIIMAHNHPSGSLPPSQSDIDLTKRVKEAGKVLELQLLDHIILSPEQNKYFSFADEGLL